MAGFSVKVREGMCTKSTIKRVQDRMYYIEWRLHKDKKSIDHGVNQLIRKFNESSKQLKHWSLGWTPLCVFFRKVDNAIHRVSHYPADSVACFVKLVHWIVIYPVNSVIQSLNK